MRSYAASILSLLMVSSPIGVILLPCDTGKYRCGEERQAVMLSLKRVHPLSFLFRALPALIPGGSPSLLTWLRWGSTGEHGG